MVERQTAIKVSIKDLLEGEYVQKEGWEPNFVRTRLGEVSRANIMGVIVQELESGLYVLDDGTGNIKIRTFEKPIMLSIGVVVLVIGRPRMYASELFLTYEIVKQITPHWLEFRKKELEFGAPVVEHPARTVISSDLGEDVVVHRSSENLFVKVLDIIRSLDKQANSQGAELDAIIAQTNHPEAEHIVNNLLEEGEIFEIRPGRVKVLE